MASELALTKLAGECPFFIYRKRRGRIANTRLRKDVSNIAFGNREIFKERVRSGFLKLFVA